MSRFGNGWKRSDKPARFRFSAHPASALSIPSSASVLPFAPRVMNQTQTSSCVGHAHACAVSTAFAAGGKPLPFVPSPKGIYTVSRCLTRAGSGFSALTDDGAMPSDAVRGISAFGVRAIQPFPDRFSDCDPSTINEEPNLAELEADSLHLVANDHGITSTGSNRVDDICRAIVAGMPVTIGVDVDNAFENWDPSMPPIGAPDPRDLLGGHDICIVAYDRTASATVFTVRNSWGLYTPDGNFLASEAWVNAPGASDIFAIGAS